MNFKHVEEQIVRARELDCMLASHAKSKRAYDKMQAIAEHLPDTMQALLDVARVAKIARTTDEYGLLSVEDGWALDRALAKLQEQNND